MAIIPRVNPGEITKVGSLPQVRNTTVVREGPSVSEAVGGLVSGASEVYEAYSQRNDQTAVLDSRRQLADWEAKVYDPGNPDGIHKYQGINALGASEALLPDLDKQISAIDANLKTPRQKAAFANVAASFRESTQSRLTSYMQGQYETGLQAKDKETQTALLNTAVNASLSGDFAAGDKRLGEGVAAITLSNSARGLPYEQAVADYTSSYRTAVIGGMLNSDTSKAMDYYAKYSKDLNAEDRIRVESALRPAAVENDAEAWYNRQVTGTPGAVGEAGMEGAASTVTQAEQIARDSVERTGGLEFGGTENPNPTSSAAGPGQFLDATWVDLLARNRPDLVGGQTSTQILSGPDRARIMALKKDPAIAKEMMGVYAVENARGLFESGLPVTKETVYLAHHFGLAGARNILRATPDTPIKDVVTGDAYSSNKYLAGKTVGEVMGNHAARAGDAPMTVTGKPDYIAMKRSALQITNKIARDARIRVIEQHESLESAAQRESDEYMLKSLNEAAEGADPTLPYDKVFSAQQKAYMRENGIVDTFSNRLKARLNGQIPVSDPIAVNDYIEMRTRFPQQFIGPENVKQILTDPSLSASDRASFMSDVATLSNPKKAEAAKADWSSDAQRIEDGVADFGWTGNGKTSKENRAAYGDAYRIAKRAAIENNGDKALSPEQLDTLSRRVHNSIAKQIADGKDPAKMIAAYQMAASGGDLRAKDGKTVRITEQDMATTRRVLIARGNANPTEAQVLAAASDFVDNEDQ